MRAKFRPGWPLPIPMVDEFHHCDAEDGPGAETRAASNPALWLLGFGAIAVGVGWVSLRGPLGLAMSSGQLAWALASVAWLLCLRIAPRGGLRPVWLVVGAVALRLLGLAGDPGLSDDIHRYVWEGGVVGEGISPYAFAPSDPRLGDQRARWAQTYHAMNNVDVSAAYPPVTQAVHAAVVAGAGGPASEGGSSARRALRGVYALCDLLVLIPLALLVRAGARPPSVLVAWGWCPLVVLEFAGSGHFDVLGILCVVIGLAAWTVNGGARVVVGAVAFGLGVAAKWLPLIAVPFAARAGPSGGTGASRGIWVRRVAGTAAVTAVTFLPLGLLEGGGSGLTNGLGEYGLRWEAASLVHRWVEVPFEYWFPRDGSFVDARRLSRLTIGLILLGVCLWLWWRKREPLFATATLMGAFLILTPTLHPWYVTWVVPFLALFRLRAFALLVVLAPVLYWPIAGWNTRGEWTEPWWMWWSVGPPVLLLLAFDCARAARTQ